MAKMGDYDIYTYGIYRHNTGILHSLSSTQVSIIITNDAIST